MPTPAASTVGQAGWSGRAVLVAVATGVAAGVGGVLLTLLLHLVQHLAFGYTENTFLVGVQRASGLRRVLAMAVGGALVGLGWWALRSRAAPVVPIDRALEEPSTRLPLRTSVADAALQILGVGCGASLGREGAPRLLGAAAAGWLSTRAGLDPATRRTLIACGAGAGLAAVYNVPVSGALFALEALLVSFAARHAVPALISSAVAVGVALPVLSSRPTYQLGSLALSPSLVVWSVLIGPFAALAASALVAGAGKARALSPTGWRLPLATIAIFTAVGALSIAFPQVLGNGKGPAQLAFDGGLGLALAGSLLVLKPLATVACLASGATGGLLTPAFATGAALGALTGGAWNLLWPGGSVAAFALVAATAVLSVSLRAPFCAIALALELTHSGLELTLPVVLAVGGALLTARLLRPRPVTDT